MDSKAPTSLEDELRSAFDALAERVRAEILAHATRVAEAVSTAAEADRAAAVADAVGDAQASAEKESAERFNASQLAAAAQLRDAEAQVRGADSRAQEAGARAELAESRARAIESQLREAESRTRDAESRASDVASQARAAETRANDAEIRADEAESRVRAIESQAQANLLVVREEDARARETEARLRDDVQRREVVAGDRLLAAIQAMDRGRSLSEILQALVTAAASEAARVGMFLVKGGRVQSWRLTGFDDSIPASQTLDLAVTEAAVIDEAARTAAAVKNGAAPDFAALPPGRPSLTVPLVMSGQVFAVLYADQGASGEIVRESWQATLEVMTRHAARALEAATAFRLAQAAAERNQARPVVTRS